jgi:hypothetical protein
MNKTMYELNWHSVNEVFSECSVTKITVIRESVLPGCTGISITAIDSDGRTFQGPADNYYETESAAWKAAKELLAGSIADHEKQLAEIQTQLFAQREYMTTLAIREDEEH